VEVIYFGTSSASVLGVYHPASVKADRLEGVVLCYPFGQEYMRSHLFYRQLSNSLSRKGYHVLRFDYQGTGDSAGDLENVTPDMWLSDIGVAIQELKDMAGISKVGLMGLRLGGLLAGKVAADRNDLSCLILWDSVVSGASYLEELHASLAKSQANKSSSNFVDADGSIHMNGFVMSAEFQSVLRTMDLRQEGQLPNGANKILQINSHENKYFDSLTAVMQGQRGFESKHTPAPHDWNYVDNLGGIMLPLPVLQAITDWM
jgi:alpha/beta superfamily hydrolase